MGEISSELKNFKTAVDPQLGAMDGMCQTIQDKIDSISHAADSAKNSIERNYFSNNKTTILRRLDKMNTVYSKIKSSVGSDLKGMVSQASSLVSMITDLENINKDIEEKQEKIKSCSLGTDPVSINTANNLRNAVNILNNKFNSTHENAKRKLAALKALDGQISFVEEFSPNNNQIDLDDLQYGTFDLKSFTASNGEVVDYYIYVPDYGKDVEGLPAMLYMHGGSTHQNLKSSDAIKYGLSSYIANKTITPSGIVIIPVVRNFDDRGVQALKELTDNVVEEYNVDTNRISVGGHSYGGITAFKLVNNYPDYFSSVVAISGSEKVTNAFNGVKVWEFGGYYETSKSYTSIYHSQNTVNEINENGGEATLTTLHTGHAGTNKQTFGQEYMSPDGIMENPLEWALRQEKA